MKLNNLFILLFSFTTISMSAQEKLIYVGDPMCSWCYGFAPQLEKLVDQHGLEMDVELVTGGLRPYFDKPISEMKDFLSHHWQDVNKASQQAFNYGILDRTDLLYDTEPACRAVVVVRHMDAEKEFKFFKMTQEAFYYHNKDLGLVESYDFILDTLDLDKELFGKRFHSDEYKELVKKDFQRASDLGVQGFPSLLLKSGDKLVVLARGYTSAEQINTAITAALKK